MATAQTVDPLETSYRILGRFAAEYRLPYWETPYEYRYLRVMRAGRLEEDLWYVTDGSHRYHWVGDCFRIERHPEESWEDWKAATERPFAEAFMVAEQKAAMLRQEVTNQVNSMIARNEAAAVAALADKESA